MEKAKPSTVAKPGVKGFQRRSDGDTDVKTLAELVISKQQSSQKLAAVSQYEFETKLADGTLCRLTDGKVTPVSGDALSFIGSMRNFERRGYLARTPADFMATMTDDMLEEVYRIAPLAAAWLPTIKELIDG